MLRPNRRAGRVLYLKRTINSERELDLAYGETVGNGAPARGETRDGKVWQFLLADRYNGLPPVTLALRENHLGSWLVAGLLDTLQIPVDWCSRYHRTRWDDMQAEWVLPYVCLRSARPEDCEYFQGVDGVRRFVSLFEFTQPPEGLDQFERTLAMIRGQGRRTAIELLAGPIIPEMGPIPLDGESMLRYRH